MSYVPGLAAALSGASVRQLSYWRSARSTEPLLRPEFYIPRSTVSYSFRDVVALRTFVYLRAQHVPLQRVRKAVRQLREFGEVGHLSEYSLVALGAEVVWVIPGEQPVDLTGRPGQRVIARMVEIFGEFLTLRDERVVNLLQPKPGVVVDQEVRGGYPVLDGTRVPYDVVAGLVEDGLSASEVVAFYPSVDPKAIQGAVEFARYVAGHDLHRLPA